MAVNSPLCVSPGINVSNLVDLLHERAINQSDQVGYCFLADEGRHEVCLSYSELEQQAQAIAAQLQHLNLQGQPALVIYPPGLDFIAAFFGCLYADVIAIPIYPPRRSLGAVRLLASNAQASAVLTLQSLLPLSEHLAGIQHWLATDLISTSQAADWQPTRPAPEALAFLQYSSGSTGQSKGVKVSHANLLHNSALIYRKFGHSSASRGVIWLPPYHDMGLIGGILQPLYGGFPVTLLSPAAFLKKPFRWLEAISRYGGTTSGGPNFAYERCIEKITAAQKAELDLSSWEVAFTGAEPIRAETLSRFSQAFAGCGFRPEAFYPCYGLAEATLFATGGETSKLPPTLSVSALALQQNYVELVQYGIEGSQNLVSCGQAESETVLLIMDAKTQQLCGAEQIGEIWITGDSVIQGYWNQPELTAQTFVEYNQAVYLRTGDLGFIHNNQLYVTGRLKDIIIIRGRNYYPQDIERTVAQSHPALSQASGAAFSDEGDDGCDRLIIVQEVHRAQWRSVDLEAVIRAIIAAVSEEHQLQVSAVRLVKPGTVPKTASGKIRRNACREEFKNGSLTVIKRSKVQNSSQVESDLIGSNSAGSNSAGSNSASAASLEKADRLIHWLRDYATHHVNSQLIDERRCISPSIILDFGNQGLLGMQVAAEYGGIELGHADSMRILQQLGAIDPTLALFVGLNNVLGIRPIAQSQTLKLKADLLPRLAAGRELAAFALTEPGAGANPQAIAAAAVFDGTGWRLNGSKIWSGSAAWAGVINVFVQHQPNRRDSDQAVHQGISGFAIQRGNPGLRQGAEALTMGMRGMVQNTLYLEDAPVTVDQLLSQPGTGMTVAQDAMMYGRLAIAAASVGGMKRCAQLMLRYSARRSIATGKLLDHPIVLTRLHRLNAAILATETLVTQIAQRLDAGESVPVEAYTACKTAAPEFYWQAADGLVQTLGGRGYIETNLAPQILRDARVLRIFEGPTETLNAFLGSRVLNQPQALSLWLIQTLKTPDICQRLLDAAAQIDDCCRRRSGFDDPLQAQRWASVLIGEITTIAILWATVQNAHEQTCRNTCHNTLSRKLKRSLDWIQSEFEQKLAQILFTGSEQAGDYTASTAASIIADYEQTIGDIEQTSAGEEQALDELLRKSAPVQTTPEFNSAQPAAIHIAQPDQQQAQIIQTWITEWLSQRLKISPEQIDRRLSFADYGIDSVIAVELAQDLESWLSLTQPLEATAAWNFPSITALADHLASLSTSSPNRPDSSSTAVLPALDLPNPQISDAELADLLAAEIAAAQRRIRR